MKAGFFYAIHVVPDLSNRRIKLGFTRSLVQRLTSYRVLSPTASLLAAWPADPQEEESAIASLRREGWVQLGSEAFDVDDPAQLCRDCEAIFGGPTIWTVDRAPLSASEWATLALRVVPTPLDIVAREMGESRTGLGTRASDWQEGSRSATVAEALELRSALHRLGVLHLAENLTRADWRPCRGEQRRREVKARRLANASP